MSDDYDDLFDPDDGGDDYDDLTDDDLTGDEAWYDDSWVDFWDMVAELNDAYA
jgi:hypothetical protein